MNNQIMENKSRAMLILTIILCCYDKNNKLGQKCNNFWILDNKFTVMVCPFLQIYYNSRKQTGRTTKCSILSGKRSYIDLFHTLLIIIKITIKE